MARKTQIKVKDRKGRVHSGTFKQTPVNPKIPVQNKVSSDLTQQATPKINTPEVQRDETGKLSGLTFPDGRILNNLKPSEVRELAAKYQSSRSLPEGTQEQGTAQKQFEAEQRANQLLQMQQQQQMIQPDLSTVQDAKPDVGQALGAGLVGAIPGLIGVGAGAALSATGVGSVAGIPIATAGALSFAGALTGFIANIRNNLKSQQTDEFTADQAALTKGERYLRALVTDTNQNPQNAAENIRYFYQTLDMIDAAHAKTWKDSQEDLNRFLGNDGTEQLARFEAFDNTMRQYYIAQFQAALISPSNTKILINNDDLAGFENEL